MTRKEFYYNLLSVFFPIFGGFLYLYIRSFYVPTFSQISYELKQLKENPELLNQLQSSTWNANLNSVSIVASILVAVVSMIVAYMYSTQQKNKLDEKDYFYIYRNIILFIVSLGMILSALSVQFWVVCMDYGRPLEDYFSARIYATTTNLFSWLFVYIAIFMLISLINKFIATLITLTSVVSFILYHEWRIYHYILYLNNAK